MSNPSLGRRRLSRLLDPSLLLTKDRKALLRFGFGLWVEDPRTDAFVEVTGATAIVVLPADLPGIDALAVDSLVEAAARATRDLAPGAEPEGIVAIVADRHGAGTNALLVSPPTLVEPAFGPGSLARHHTAAEAAGARILELDGPLSFDLDTAADLLTAESELGSLLG